MTFPAIFCISKSNASILEPNSTDRDWSLEVDTGMPNFIISITIGVIDKSSARVFSSL